MNLKDIPSKEIMPGYHGKLVHGEKMSWAFWTVEEDAEVQRDSSSSDERKDEGFYLGGSIELRFQ